MKTLNTDITIDSYNRSVEKYAEKFMDFKSYKEKMRVFQQIYLTPKSNILDIGCDPGNNAKFLIENDGRYKIDGFDLSAEMINIAKRNVPGCHFWAQDIRDLNPDKEYGSLYLSFMEGKKAGFETTSFSDHEIFFNYHDRDAIKSLFTANSIETIEILNDSNVRKRNCMSFFQSLSVFSFPFPMFW